MTDSTARLLSMLLATAAAAMLAGCALDAGARTRSASAPSAPFVDIAARAGIDFVQRTGKGVSIDIIQTSAGGCGVIDYDRDGWLDLFLVQGKHQPGSGGGNRLYRNRGDGTFEDVTERAGVRGRGYGMACAVGDYDADGWPDLYVCNYGVNELYRNRGDGTFEEVAARVGADVRGSSVGAVFADLDGDGWPDLYVARYIEVTPHSPMICQLNGVPTSCGPALYEPQPGVFLKNLAGRRFADRTRAAGLVNTGRAMAVSVLDVNEDGHLDLFVANDTTANALFLGDGKGRFREGALAAGVAYGDLGASEANMGCDFGDYDGDGRFDLFIGVMQDRMSLLFRSESEGFFRFVTREANLAAPTAGVVTFGCGFFDYDNDGDLDLFQANGHVHDHIQEVDPRLRYAQPRQLVENDGNGRFIDRTVDAGPAISAPAVGRGVAFGDLDNDGDVDIVVNNLDGPPMLLMNQAERLARHWLRVRLEGKHPNLLPEGTVVELVAGGRKRIRHLHTAYSYAAANDPRVHFGLGSDRPERLTVRWPNGARQEVSIDGTDREIVVRQQ